MLTSIPFVIDDNSIALQPPGRWEAVWLYIPHGLAIKHIVAGPEDSQPTAAATTCYWGSTPPQANASGPPTASHTPPATHVAHPAAAQCFSTRPAEQPGEASARKVPVTAFNIQEAQVPGATADADHSDTSTARTPTRRRRRGRGRGRTPPGSDSSGPSQEVRDPSTCGHFGGGDGEPGHEGDKQHTKICTASAEHFYIGGNEPEPEVTAVAAVTVDTVDMMQTTTILDYLYVDPAVHKKKKEAKFNMMIFDPPTENSDKECEMKATTENSDKEAQELSEPTDPFLVKKRPVGFAAESSMKKAEEAEEKKNELTDGNTNTVGNEQIRCPDITNQPSFIGKEPRGVQDTTIQSDMKCDDDISKDLYDNVNWEDLLAKATQENLRLKQQWREKLKQQWRKKHRS